MEQTIVRKILRIKGMTCTGCEMRIGNELRKLEGMMAVEAIFTSSNVYVTYDVSKLGLDRIIQTIEEMDYKVENIPYKGDTSSEGVTVQDGHKYQKGSDRRETGQTGTSENSEQKRLNIGNMVGIGIILFAFYIIIKNTVGFNFVPQIDQSMGLGILFVIGLLTSLHCIAMCGGINLSVCMKYNTDGDGSKFGKMKPAALYNLGRVISYTLIGGLVGALGSAITFSGRAKGIIAVLSGIFMVVMGLNMLNIFPWLRKFNPRLPKFLGRKVHTSSGEKGPLVVGLLNGLMPCGPLQAMQLYALGTGSFTAGALSMFLFSAGTVPLMFGFGAISSMLKSKFTHKLLKGSAVLVIVLGIIMFNRGLNQSGFGIVSAASAAQGNSSIAKVANGVQEVTTKLEAGRYTPIVVQKGIPVRWTIQVGKGDLNGCNNPVTIPEYNIQKKLVPGDNIIEFIPDNEGNIIYTCWMGMISSNIRVVPDVGNITEKELQNNDGNVSIQIPTEKLAIGEIREDGIQYVSIDVNENEFSPAVVVLQQGIETQWVINGVQLNDHNSSLIFPEYNARLSLEKGENLLKFIPEVDFTFQCTLGKLNGYIKVVEDITDIDQESIRNEVENYQPAYGGFGGYSGRPDRGSSGGGASCH